jgi:signal transduction histidine kinase
VERFSTPGWSRPGRHPCETRCVSGAWWQRLVPERPRHESGIPVDTDADALVFAVQPLFIVAVVILCVITMEPLGLHGWGLVGLVALVVNPPLMLTRSLPDRWVPLRVRFWIALVAAVTAGTIFGVDAASWAEAFGFALVVHAAVRFEPYVAAGLALLCAGTAAVVLLVRAGETGVPPWWVAGGLLLVAPFGMLRRSRRKQLATANELVVQTRKAAAGQARAELARDLHDVLAHSLSGVNMQLSLADALLEAGRLEQGREAVASARTMVVDGLAEARRAVSVLREGALDLVPTLRAMVTGAGETCEVVGPEPALGDAETQAFVRVAQESLTNARRHAPGAPVRVRLSSGPVTRLEVDNGPAALPRGDEGGGMGLVGMRERAAAIGATLSAGPVTSGRYAGGWSVVLELAR